jgi:5-methylthioribose kinase
LFDDSLGFAASEMIRRILGLAHVADLDGIADPEMRALCEARALRAARELLVNHRMYTSIKPAIAMMREERARSAL